MPAQTAHRGLFRLLLLLAILLMVGWLDYRSDPELGFSLFYVPPVAAAGWWFGRRGAAVMGVLGALLWTAADAAARQPPGTGSRGWRSSCRSGC